MRHHNLQETADADLLLHVVDASNPHFPEQIAQVQQVLAEIGAAEIPQILVFNKLDALEKDRWPLQLEDMFEINGLQTPRVFVSARNSTGLDTLRGHLATTVSAAAASPSASSKAKDRLDGGELAGVEIEAH